MADLPDPALLTVEQVAQRLHLSRSKAWELVSSGELPSITIGRSRRVSVASLQQWIKEKESSR